MTETVSLKRPRSTSNNAEEPDEKYSAHMSSQPILINPATLGAMSAARGAATTAGFPLLQYCQMIQQMQNQQMELPMAMMRKEREETATASGSSSRRQTMSTSSMTPRPIRVPTQPFINPLQFFPAVMAQQPPEVLVRSPSPARSPQHTYHVPSFQRADEEIFSKFVDSVRKLAAKLTAERS